MMAQDCVPTQVRDLEIDWLCRRIHKGGRAIQLSPQEFSLLLALVTHRGRPVSRSVLRCHLYGEPRANSNVIDVLVSSLRDKLGSDGDPPLIVTCRRVGYMLRDETAGGSGANEVVSPSVC
jgi:two-component system OmpR family response regulator